MAVVNSLDGSNLLKSGEIRSEESLFNFIARSNIFKERMGGNLLLGEENEEGFVINV